MGRAERILTMLSEVNSLSTPDNHAWYDTMLKLADEFDLNFKYIPSLDSTIHYSIDSELTLDDHLMIIKRLKSLPISTILLSLSLTDLKGKHLRIQWKEGVIQAKSSFSVKVFLLNLA